VAAIDVRVGMGDDDLLRENPPPLELLLLGIGFNLIELNLYY
jgi:hypothetical protein